MIFEYCKWDPQTQDRATLAATPLVLRREAWAELSEAAELLFCETILAEQELLGRPDLQRRLGLSSWLRRALAHGPPLGSGPRVMRFDFHPTHEGWALSEVNADVPGGYVEASGFSALAAEVCPRTESPGDPAEMLARALRRRLRGDATVALVHATAYSDDAQVVRFLAAKLRTLGLGTVELGPAQLSWRDHGARVLGDVRLGDVAAIFRFFPAEWLRNLPRATALPYFANRWLPQTNPASALLAQSKRMPLVWDEMRTPLPTWRRLLPTTAHPRRLAPADDGWVLKPALGRVGEGVGIAGVTPPALLRRIRLAARLRPDAWIAQRRFHSLPWTTSTGILFPSVGVFVVDGKSAGAYGRAAARPLIDRDAADVAVLVEARFEGGVRAAAVGAR
ncbi:MAG TPA: glutathionylspermidine synthase family protein [Candidatus Polarisedimenticolaceae bacterium]|nr:glutathionylspermidine synthase family protein [Candidatus Polarisedimenticolaceae bacterium]